MRIHDHDVTDTLRPKASRLDAGPSPETAKAAAVGRSDVLDPAAVLGLQRAVGNAGVGSLLEEDRSPIHDVIGSSGSPLAADVRAEMEGRLGQDFSDVRVHNDSAAHDSAAAVNAHAYTVGSNVVFQRGRYDTGSAEGKTMLAHELTHVVQQRSGPVDGTDAGGGIKVSDPSDRFEREAAANADAVMAAPAPTQAHDAGAGVGPSVQRDAELDEAPEDAVQGSFVQRDEVPEEAPEEEPGEEVAQGSFEGASVQLAAAEEAEVDASPGCC
jgi:hypothetical protein